MHIAFARPLLSFCLVMTAGPLSLSCSTTVVENAGGGSTTSGAGGGCAGADTTSDPDNCGACGHGCQGGACVASTCQPVVLSVAHPISLAVDAAHVYWSDLTDGTPGPFVMKVPLGGGPATKLTAGLAAITVNGATLYGLGNGSFGVAELPTSGGTKTALTPGAMGQAFWTGPIVADSTNVYWIVLGTLAAQFQDGMVMKLPIGGGSPTPLTTGQNFSAEMSGIAVDATHVYWTAGSHPPAHDGTVMMVPIGGGAPVQLAGSQAGPTGIAVDATHVYWASFGDGTIQKVPLSGGAPVLLASLPNARPGDIAVDGTAVYVVATEATPDGWSHGQIARVPLGGGSPIALASEQKYPFGVTVDATTVYWANTGTCLNPIAMPCMIDGAVMKLAKP